MKYDLFVKIKAGALQYAIFISVIIALLISAVLALSYLQSHFKVKVSNYKIAVQVSNDGLYYGFNNDLPYDQIEKIKLNNSEKNNTAVIKTHWGVFDLIKVNSKIGNESFQKIVLTGGFQKQRNALYLQDTKRPLVVVGDTKISGNAALPESGVKRGTIAGRSYSGESLIYGNTSTSRSSLPPLKNKNYLKQFAENISENENLVFFDLYENNELVNSFYKPTKISYNNGEINLQYLKLTGNIIIQSDTLIRVDKTTLLSDVILIAPKIEIKENVIGNFQAFATEKISIAKGTTLNYPTALILTQKSTSSKNNKDKSLNKVLIDNYALVKGAVCYLSNEKQGNYQPQILIEETAKVVGEVYCDQNTELKGMVEGMVYTKGFIASQFGSIYQNHIYKGKIIEGLLPKQYCGLNFVNTKKSIVKWMY